VIVPFSHVLAVSTLLFFIGAACAASRRNLVMILVGVEVMLNAAALAFVGAALRWGDLDGQAVVLFIMAVAAAEVSVGLALVVCAGGRRGTVEADRFDALKG